MVAAMELEICSDTAAGIAAADAGGADRIELCAGLALGGLTPSQGLMELAGQGPLPCRAMIRPRAGDFVFCDADFAVMARDVAAARAAGLEGVVLGAATASGVLDLDMLARLRARATGMGATLHRVIDTLATPLDAIDQAVALGFDRILTSGCAPSAHAGRAQLRAMVAHAAGRITIMAGAGITASNAGAIIADTGVRALHGSCSGPAAHSAHGQLPAQGGGETGTFRVTDPAKIAALRAAMQGP